MLFFAFIKVFRKFGDRNIVLANSPYVSSRTGDLLRTTCGKRCVYPVNYQSENGIADKRRYFLGQVLIAQTSMVFTKWVASRVTLE